MKSIIVHDWMLKDPRLSGIKLLIYAVVYGFVSLGHSCFLSAQCWIDFLGCSRSQLYKALKELTLAGILIADKNGAFYAVDIFYEPVLCSYDSKTDLDEMIRIAKTPWVFDD